MTQNCSVKGCLNSVTTARVKLGYSTCLELHGQVAKIFTVVPVPKSNGVVGTTADLKGVSSSHKGTNPNSLGGTDWYLQFPMTRSTPTEQRVIQPTVQIIEGLSNHLAILIRDSKENSVGDHYCTGNLGMAEGYQKGLLTARKEPSRLTVKGKIIKQKILNGHRSCLELI